MAVAVPMQEKARRVTPNSIEIAKLSEVCKGNAIKAAGEGDAGNMVWACSGLLYSWCTECASGHPPGLVTRRW